MTRVADRMAEKDLRHPGVHPGVVAGWVRWLRAGGKLGEWADNTLAEVYFASHALLLEPDDRILNLSCGWGRHALALASAGYRVIGLESSADLLTLARDTGKQLGVEVSWVHGLPDDLRLGEPVSAVVQFHGNPLAYAEGPAEALFALGGC